MRPRGRGFRLSGVVEPTVLFKLQQIKLSNISPVPLMIIDSLFMWLVAVPATFLAAYVFKLPPVWVYFVMTLDEFEKMPVVFIHYFRKKWLTNITRDFD